MVQEQMERDRQDEEQDPLGIEYHAADAAATADAL